MNAKNTPKESDRTYMMQRSLNEDFQPCYRIVFEVNPDDLNKNYMQFSPKQLILQGEEETDGLYPVKLNWSFLTVKHKDFGWLVPVVDTISPKAELELFQALSCFFERVGDLNRS